MQQILLIPEFMTPNSGLNFQGTGALNNPIGAKIISSPSIEDTTIIGIDKNFAANYITSNFFVESDKIIDKQISKSVITARYAFVKVFNKASAAIKL